MAPSPTPSPVTPATATAVDSEQTGLFDTHGNVFGDPAQFELQPGRTTGEIWTLNFHCKGAPAKNEFLHMEIDRGDITYYNLLSLKSKLGYAARDFLYYKKRCGRDVARLEVIDFDHQAEAMVANGEGERKARLVLTNQQPKVMQVTISPMKRMREKPISDEDGIHDTLDEYKIWLHELKKEHANTDRKDDFRDHTIKTYTEWLNYQRLMEHIVSSLKDNGNGVDERSTSPKERPSHARRATCTSKDFRQPNKRTDRGTLKGLAAAMKRIKSGSQKLEIGFSKKTGGPVGINHRSFVDEVLVFTRQKAPLIGVRTWNDIEKDVKESIASDILSRWELKDTMDAKEKILVIANMRYRGWRGTLSATSKAYGSYSEAIKNKPEDADIVEWHYLYMYFNTPDFKQVSCGKSKCRSKKRTTHLGGSKPFSQYSYEQRDPQTGEEPSDLTLWMSTHMKNGRWSDEIAKAVYDNANDKMIEIEVQRDYQFMQTEEMDNIFQSSYNDATGCKSSRLHRRGYLSKRQTLAERMRAKMDEQARATAATELKNAKLEEEVKMLKEQLRNEASERDRIQEERDRQMEERHASAMESAMEKIREEMKAMVAQNQPATEQAKLASKDTSDDGNRPNISRALFQNTKAIGSATYISSQQLRSLANTRSRS